MQVNQADVAKTLRCTKCRETFRNTTETLVKKVRYETGKEIIGVACQNCEERFGIKPPMSGKKVACPVCSTRQQFILEEATPVESGAKPVGEASPENQTETGNSPKTPAREAPAAAPAKAESPAKAEPPKAVVKKEAGNGNRATVVHSTAASSEAANRLSEKAQALLPPRYTVEEEIERAAASEFRKKMPKGIKLGIDTDTTRIHQDGQAIPVRSLTLDEKRRRKRLRVAIVYLFSIAVLVGWFIWLLKRFDSGG